MQAFYWLEIRLKVGKGDPHEAISGVKERRDYGLEQGIGTGAVTALQLVLPVNWLQVNTLPTC